MSEMGPDSLHIMMDHVISAHRVVIYLLTKPGNFDYLVVFKNRYIAGIVCLHI